MTRTLDLNGLFRDTKKVFWDYDELHNYFYQKIQDTFTNISSGMVELESNPETLTIFIMTLIYNHFQDIWCLMDSLEECNELNERFSEEELNGKVSLDEIFDYGKAFGSNEPNEENDFLEELDTEEI